MTEMPTVSAGLAYGEADSEHPVGSASHRRMWWALGCLSILLLGFVGISYYFQLLRVASVLGFSQRRPAVLIAYDRLFNHDWETRDLVVPGTAGPVSIRVYSASGVRNPAPIVLVHGFTEDGNRDPYLNDVAKRLAPMGFYVVLPTIPGETAFEMRVSDLRVIDDTIRWAAENTRQKVSVLGVSFGGGLTVPAAANPTVSKYVKLIVCISGYNDLESIGRYFIHDQVLDPEDRPYQGAPPGPLVITAPYLDELVDKDDIAAVRILVDRFNHNKGQPLPANDPVWSRVSARDRAIYEELQSVQSDELKQRFRALLARHRKEFEAMSPDSVLPNLRTRIYVLHGVADPVFPPGEAEWMRKELEHNPHAHLLITPWISHVFVGAPASKFEHWRTMQFCAQMLGDAAHREMLKD